MSVEKQNFICRAYSRVFVGLFLDWVSNGMKAKDLAEGIMFRNAEEFFRKNL